MTVLLQISDPHFGTEQAQVVDAVARLAAEQSPDVLLLSGDITQRATSAQFAAARAFVERLRIRNVVAIPGNHDIPLYNPVARLVYPYARYRRAFGNQIEPEYESENALVLAVNTTRRLRHVDGEISDAQIERVARRFERARMAQWRIVLLHQPVAVTRDQDRHNLLHGRDAAIQRWSAAGADLIVGGHIHLPFVLPLRERWPNLQRNMWAVQAGTAVSVRVRADVGNSVNVIRLGVAAARNAAVVSTVRSCVVERWDFLPDSARFELVTTNTISVDLPS